MKKRKRTAGLVKDRRSWCSHRYLNADRVSMRRGGEVVAVGLLEVELRRSMCPMCRWGYAELRRRVDAGELRGVGVVGSGVWAGGGLMICDECRGDLVAIRGMELQAELGVNLGWSGGRGLLRDTERGIAWQMPLLRTQEIGPRKPNARR